jgi:hypothetical protein
MQPYLDGFPLVQHVEGVPIADTHDLPSELLGIPQDRSSQQEEP